MISLNIQLPDLLYKKIVTFAAKENISIDQLVTNALLAQLESDLLAMRAKRGSWDKFQKVLAKVCDVELEQDDKL